MRFLSLVMLGTLAGAPLALAENPPPHHAHAPGNDAPRINLVDATYLGVASESISLERAGDLQLPPGTGLSVLMIVPGSPASKAGLQPGDVLTKLDDQLLVNPAQLRVLVRLHKDGDAITFQIVRQGKAQTIKATLGARKMPELTPGGEERRMLLPQGGGIQIMPFEQGQLPPERLKEFRQRVQDQLRAQGKALDANLEGFKIIDEAIDALVDGAPGEIPGGLRFSSSMTSNDGTHTITVRHGQRGHLSITNKDGTGIYDGDIPANDKEWEKVPEEVRAKAKNMCKNGVRVQQIAPKDIQEVKPGQSF